VSKPIKFALIFFYIETEIISPKIYKNIVSKRNSGTKIILEKNIFESTKVFWSFKALAPKTIFAPKNYNSK